MLGIGVLAAGVDVATANNTVAIVMTGELAKDISREYGIEPKQTASLLDIFTSVVQGILPYGAQLLYASAASAGALTSFAIVPYCFYPMLGGSLRRGLHPHSKESLTVFRRQKKLAAASFCRLPDPVFLYKPFINRLQILHHPSPRFRYDNDRQGSALNAPAPLSLSFLFRF